MNRHQNLTARTPERLGQLRKNITEEHIRSFFSSLEQFLLKEHDMVASEFFTEENRSRIFNLDESGFPLGGSNKLKIVTQRGSKAVYNVTGENREQITVLFCAAADGTFEKPLVIFPGIRPTEKKFDKDKYSIAYTKSGWITAESFLGWFCNLFIKSVKERGVTFPIIVFMDGHTTHINMAIIEFCRDNQIILFCLPAHASHILQPLDVSVFGPLKQFWNKSIENFKMKYHLSMTKANFFPVFDEAFQKAKNRPENVASGFRKCGLVPFNVEAVDYSKLIDYEKIEQRLSSRDSLTSEQRLGSIVAYRKAVNCLSEERIKMFEERYEEGYNVIENSALNELWNVYKCLRGLSEQTTRNVPVSFNEMNNNSDTTVTDMQAVSQGLDSPPLPDEGSGNLRLICSTPKSSEVVSSNSPMVITSSKPNETLQTTMNSPIPGTSKRSSITRPLDILNSPVPGSSRQSSAAAIEEVPVEQNASSKSDTPKYYDRHVESPFKSYFKMKSDFSIMTKVVKTKFKSTLPPAVSGVDYMKFMERKVEKKKEEEENKMKRKEEREKKKQEKEKKKKTVARNLFDSNNNSTDESTDFQVELDDSDDIIDLPINTEECAACESDHHKNNADHWMGCNYCSRWYHKSCFSGDYELMSHDEIEELDFKCDICIKIENAKNKRK